MNWKSFKISTNNKVFNFRIPILIFPLSSATCKKMNFCRSRSPKGRPCFVIGESNTNLKNSSLGGFTKEYSRSKTTFIIFSALNLFLMFLYFCVYSFCQVMNLNSTQIGLIFLVYSLLYALVTPLAGWIGDKTVSIYWICSYKTRLDVYICEAGIISMVVETPMNTLAGMITV